MRRPIWTLVLGIASILILSHFWTLTIIAGHREVHYPGELSGVMIAMLLALAASTAAAVKGSRWWSVASFWALGTIVLVILRLH
jgi:hypothetical protein